MAAPPPSPTKCGRPGCDDGEEPSLTLTLESPDGDGGFPGALTTTVTYTITRNNELKLDYRAAAVDRPTVANLTNHSYFALQGEGNGDISEQTIQVFADKYTPADADNLETGEILPVDGTPLDFRKPVRLGDVLHSAFPQIAMRQGLDMNFVVNGKPGTLRPAGETERSPYRHHDGRIHDRALHSAL